MDDIFEGVVMIMFFVSIYLVFLYVNKRGVGDWDRYRQQESFKTSLKPAAMI